MKRGTVLLAASLSVASVASSHAASYTVDGFTLGQSVVGQARFKSFKCADSSFGTECDRSEERKTKLGIGTLSSKIIYGDGGAAVYLMTSLAPVRLDEKGITKEIAGLSNEFKQRPIKVEWLAKQAGLPRSVIAVWGDVELIEVHPEDLD
jgi:hypothetical protein